MITFNNIVERFKIFAENHFFIETFSFGSPDDVDLTKFTSFPLMHLVYTGATYDPGTKTYNLEIYILDVPADKTAKVDRQKEVVSDAEQCAEDIIADIKNGGNIFLFAQDYEVVNATTTPLEEETKNVLSGVLLDLSVSIPYEWDACNAPIDGVEPGGTEVTYARRGVLRMLTLDGATDVPSVRTIKVTNGTLTDDGDGVVTLDTGGVDRLEDLDDVSVVTPANREALIYDGDNWVNDSVTASDVGLGNVDNTSDADKPVSTATQTALDLKANTADVPTELNDLSDVTISGTPTGNQALIYNAATSAFLPLDNFTNRFEDDVERGSGNITPFVERAYGVKSDGDGIFIDNQSDTPSAGKVIVRKIYHKAGLITDTDVIGDYTLIHTFDDDTAYSATTSTFEGFRDGDTYGTPPFTLIQTWEEQTAAPAFTGLLNETYGSGAAAAYGTRRLNGNYSGACMTIRRASDGTTTTIGFDGEDVDEAAIETFCTGTTCTVQVWHDQSQSGGTGSGNDASQTDSTKQPTIYTGGALVKEGGRLALRSQAGNIGLTASVSGSTNYFAFSIVKTETRSMFVASANSWMLPAQSGSAVTAQSSGATINNIYVDGASYTWSNWGDWYNEISNQKLITLDASNSAWADLDFGWDASNNYGMYTMQEFVLYASDKSTDRTSIEGNISAYYQSAKLLNEAYGSGAAAAYSVRLLDRDYTGSAIEVERSSDNTTQNIGFDSNGDLDESALSTFCSGTVCKVRTWFDQSGNSNDAVQTTHANQPTIYTGGAIVKENGKPAVDFDGADDYVFNNSLASSFASNLSSFSVGKATAVGTKVLYGFGNTSDNDAIRYFGTSAVDDQKPFFQDRDNSASSNNAYVFAGDSTSQHLASIVSDFTSSRSINVDSVATDTDSTSLGAVTLNTFALGALIRVSTGLHLDGNIQEAIFYASDKSTDRTSIESNIGDYFTQNTPLLDTYTGAAAAYSLRKLRSAYSGSAIRVRRSNDNAETDIGFNVFGELDTVSLASFCSGTDGFVKTWYDQSGNANDATQTTAANQPKIYDSVTGVVTENGKPIIKTVSANTMALPFNDQAYKIYAVFNGENINTGNILLAPNYFLVAQSGSGTSPIYSGFTVNDIRKNGSNITIPATWGDAYTAYASQNLSYFDIDVSSSNNLQLGFQSGANYPMYSMQEIVFYPDTSSHTVANIEDNINTFYSIY